MLSSIRNKLLMFFVLSFPAALMASHKEVEVKGGGTYVNPNSISTGFNSNVSKFHIKADKHGIKKGLYSVSSKKAGPIDPVTGIEFEMKAKIDKVRVFKSHPDVVWCHGHATSGYIKFGTSSSYGSQAGTTTNFNHSNGEVIGAVTPWGRTNFVTVFENGGNPLPNIETATEAELIEFVQGFSRILLRNGSKPAKMHIKTEGGSFIIEE